MYINLVNGSDYVVRILINNKLANRIAATEGALLICSCKHSQSPDGGDCSHIKTAHARFRQWKSKQLRKLRREIVGSTPVEVLFNTASQKLGVDLRAATLVPLDDGAVAVQWSGDAAKKYSYDCGWGTCGQDVVLIDEWPLVGILQVLTQSPEQTVWDYNVEQTFLFPRPLPVLPPVIFGENVSDAHNRQAATLDKAGGGLLNLETLFDNDDHDDSGEASPWGAFWAALCGLKLDGELIGRLSYLPANHTADQTVGGLAFDLLHQKVKAIPSSEIERYTVGIPEQYRSQVGHVHLPWGVEHDDTIPYQVIVRHPSLPRLVRDDSVVVLTTNLWQEDQYEGVHDLLAHAAGYLIRMGHSPGVYLHYGEKSYRLGELAGSANSHNAGGPWNIKPEAWDILAEKVVVAAHNGVPVDDDVKAMNLGPDWPLLLPPESE